jgi:hypothetical protein
MMSSILLQLLNNLAEDASYDLPDDMKRIVISPACVDDVNTDVNTRMDRPDELLPLGLYTFNDGRAF